MTGEDLTIQPGLALQQDLALVSLLGLTHVERNGHHYVNGMAGLPRGRAGGVPRPRTRISTSSSHGAVRVRITGGMLAIGSLDCTGLREPRAMPDWNSMKEMPR